MTKTSNTNTSSFPDPTGPLADYRRYTHNIVPGRERESSTSNTPIVYDTIRYVSKSSIKRRKKKADLPFSLALYTLPANGSCHALYICPAPPEPAGARNPRVQWRFVVRGRIHIHTYLSLSTYPRRIDYFLRTDSTKCAPSPPLTRTIYLFA